MLLLDANVWVYVIAWPTGLARDASKDHGYSDGLKRFRASGARILVDSHVMSEVVNRMCRLCYNSKFTGIYKDFKCFRQSRDYVAVGQDLASIAGEILRIAEPVDSCFAGIDRGWVVSQVEAGQMDFNDAFLVQNCAKNGWTLVTHDADITEGGIEVVTSNSKLLRICG